MFLYKFNAEILELEFPYLYLEGDNKKALALFPNIILKCVDIGVQETKEKFQLCIGLNYKMQYD